MRNHVVHWQGLLTVLRWKGSPPCDVRNKSLQSGSTGVAHCQRILPGWKPATDMGRITAMIWMS